MWPFVNNTIKCTFKEIETEKKKRRNSNIEKAAWDWRKILNWIREIGRVRHYYIVTTCMLFNLSSLGEFIYQSQTSQNKRDSWFIKLPAVIYAS